MTPAEFVEQRRRKALLERWLWGLACIRVGARNAGLVMGERVERRLMVPWDRA